MSKTVIALHRIIDTEMGTIGRMFMPELSLYTMERPWKDNARWISCIPPGLYDLTPRKYNRGGYWTWELQDVPDRSLILIHRGNVVTDVQGCIAVGLDLGVVYSKWAVTSSRIAFNQFHQVLSRLQDAGRDLAIEIHQPFGGKA